MNYCLPCFDIRLTGIQEITVLQYFLNIFVIKKSDFRLSQGCQEFTVLRYFLNIFVIKKILFQALSAGYQEITVFDISYTFL